MYMYICEGVSIHVYMCERERVDECVCRCGIETPQQEVYTVCIIIFVYSTFTFVLKRMYIHTCTVYIHCTAHLIIALIQFLWEGIRITSQVTHSCLEYRPSSISSVIVTSLLA